MRKVVLVSRLLQYAALRNALISELGEQGLTPASSQVTYLLLLTSFFTCFT